MKNNNQHIIHQVNMKVFSNSEQRAFRLKNELDSFLKEDFLPTIELLFDEMHRDNQTIRYSSIDLEVNINTTESLEIASGLLIEQLRAKLQFSVPEYSFQLPVPGIADSTKKMLRNGSTKSENKEKQPFVSEPISDEEDALLSFLETGQLPWFIDPMEFAASIESKSISILIQNKVFIQKLKSVFTTNPNSLERFVQQMNLKITIELISHLANTQSIDKKKMKSELTELPLQIQVSTCKLIIGNLIGLDQQAFVVRNHEFSESSSLPMIKSILKMVGLNALTENMVSTKVPDNKNPLVNEILNQELGNKKPSKSSVDLKSIYIQNAGMILAHPFISQLFIQTGCADENKNLLPAKKQKAVQLLHYLASGEETDMEFNLTFEKYLVELPLETPLSRISEIDETDKMECDEVLRSIVDYWPELKNTSPEGLRQLFFRRNGKLDLNQTPHKLYVERKAQDVLLDKLQWNISIVKLPWMNDLLYVEW
jgi:hypothetical protein